MIFLTKGRLVFILLVMPFFFSCRSIRSFSDNAPRFHKEQRLGSLHPGLNETSGLEIMEGKFLSFNDSGGNPELYAFSADALDTFTIIPVPQAYNRDWEEIARDSAFLYIGDTGNNAGMRDDLRIYKLKIGALTAERGEIISYRYADLEEGEKGLDCEAICSIGDSLCLVTKGWGDRSPRIYMLPKKEGDYEVYPREKLQTSMLVTAADFDPEKQFLYLMGYKNFVPAMEVYHFDREKGSSILYSIRFFNLYGLQTEALVLTASGVYFSHEASKKPQGLYFMRYKSQ